jgi:hypothetical protein
MKYSKTIGRIVTSLLPLLVLASASFAATNPLANPFGMAVDAKGNLWVANGQGGKSQLVQTDETHARESQFALGNMAVSTAWTSREIIWLFPLVGAVNLLARALATRLPTLLLPSHTSTSDCKGCATSVSKYCSQLTEPDTGGKNSPLSLLIIAQHCTDPRSARIAHRPLS